MMVGSSEAEQRLDASQVGISKFPSPTSTAEGWLKGSHPLRSDGRESLICCQGLSPGVEQ